MGYYNFPHTRNYDTDLGYLIKKYETLEETYKILLNYVEHLKTVGVVESSVKFFNTAEEMKASTVLKLNDFAITLGYYEINDGGVSLYRITNINNSENFTEVLENSLFAELIIFNNTINIKQLGAKPSNNEVFDIAPYIDKYTNKIAKYKKNVLRLYIPAGVWATSGNFIPSYSFIYGDGLLENWERGQGTVITSIHENQDHIFSVGNSSSTSIGWTLSDLTFSSASYEFSDGLYSIRNNKQIQTCLKIEHGEYAKTDNLYFMYIVGTPLSICSSWEIYFKLLNFRFINNLNGACINFRTVNTSLSENANITALTFEKIMFEELCCTMINFERSCKFFNNHFGVINAEVILNNSYYQGTLTTFTNDNISTFNDLTAEHFSVFTLEDGSDFGACTIDAIELENYAINYLTYLGKNYTFDTIINYKGTVNCYNIFNKIALDGHNKDIKVIYLPSTITHQNQYTGYNKFGQFITNVDKNFILDVNGLTNVEILGKLNSRNLLRASSVTPVIYAECGGWLPCWKYKNNSPTGGSLGSLYYDPNCINELHLAVRAGEADNLGEQTPIMSIVNPNKKLYLRVKVDNGITAMATMQNMNSRDSFSIAIHGTGNYEIIEFNIPESWKIGDKISISAWQNITTMYYDCYLSV